MADTVYHLVVTQAHAEYARGDLVTDPTAIEALLRDHPSRVVKVLPAKPA